MKPDEILPFDAALPLFRTFIAEQGFDPELAWVFRDDVDGYRGTLWIRSPVPSTNLQLACDLYECASRAGFGLSLSVLAKLRASSACRVDVHGGLAQNPPAHRVGLTFNVPADGQDAVIVDSWWRWQVHRCVKLIRRDLGRARFVASRSEARAFIHRSRSISRTSISPP